MYGTSEDELKKTYKEANNLITDILKKKPCLASECKHENLENVVTGLSTGVIFVIIYLLM